MKILRQSHKSLKHECDVLWSYLIKLRAGMKSELSGKTDHLNSHHLRGKSCYALRYSLDNGFCCTGGEHKFGFHHSQRRAGYEEKVKVLRGADIFEKLEALGRQKGESNLSLTKIWLQEEIKKYEGIAA